MSSNLTCISCKLVFSVPELHQAHYKSEWHCYNLKRRLSELPSLTKEEFEKKAISFREASEVKDKKISLRCDSCNKAFSSQNAMVSHLKSNKHLRMESSSAKGQQETKQTCSSKKEQHLGQKLVESEAEAICEEDEDEWMDEDDGEDWESCDEEEEEGVKRIIVDTNDCLFCENQSDSTEGNVSHMTTEHSFYIPDIEYVSNLDGLIATLAGKIHMGHLCLWCDGKGRGFKSVKAVRGHMLDKGHYKMLYEGEAILDYADFYDYSSMKDNTDIGDMSVIEELLGNSEYELILPSGATIGHRSLAVYFKQNLKPASCTNQMKVKKIIQQYKALGYTGTTGAAALKVARDITYVKRIKSKYDLKLAVKSNKFQPHFRSQVMF